MQGEKQKSMLHFFTFLLVFYVLFILSACKNKNDTWANKDELLAEVKYSIVEISTEQFIKTYQDAEKDFLLIDVRQKQEFTDGFKTATGTDVLNNPTSYFINNYFSETDYSGFGHVDGAYRVHPLTLADDLTKNLDPAGKIVTYCYTGQASAVITAYLNVLGYDAYSMTFGMNGIYNNNTAWTTNQWGGDSNPKNLSTVTK
jgi:rhodanese-related sulfurtransferase